MIAADIGGDSEQRMKNVGGVEPPPQSGFNDSDVDL